MQITYGYIHNIYVTYGYIQFTYWPFSTAFGDSDDEGGQDPSFDGGPDLADPDVEPDAHDPAPVTAAPDHQPPLPGPASIPPFHFMNFISKTGVANFQTCFLLFEIDSRTDDGIKRHKCAFVSVLEEFTGDQKPGIINTNVIYAMYNTYVTYIEYIS